MSNEGCSCGCNATPPAPAAEECACGCECCAEQPAEHSPAGA
jgi:hypothetical protein